MSNSLHELTGSQGAKFGQYLPMAVGVLLIGVIGAVLLASSHAATLTASVESEAGANIAVNDSTASGGKALKFGAGAQLQTCDLNATTTTFGAQLTAATNGQTICLAAGDYGQWSGTSKAVTIRAASGAAPTMTLYTTIGNGLTLDGLTFTGGSLIGGTAKNMTIKNSTFTGTMYVGPCNDGNNVAMAGCTNTGKNADGSGIGIVLDHNTHTSPDGGQAQVFCSGGYGAPRVDLIVKNSTFTNPDGLTDGLRGDCDGMQIIGNRIMNFRDPDANHHTDPIQLYGGTNIVIKGNYFDNNGGNVSSYIMLTNSGTVDVEDNVFRAGGVFYLVGSATTNLTFVHNTAEAGATDSPDTSCNAATQRCCFTSYNRCAMNSVTVSGTYINKDNILYDEDGSYNLLFGKPYGNPVSATNHDFNGTPQYVGPLDTWAGWKLKAGSPGIGGADDGSNVGIVDY